MKIFGFEITRTKATPSPVFENRGGWFPLIRESFTGAWQHNIQVDRNLVLSNPTVFKCNTRIASDCAKMPLYLERLDGNGIWTEFENPAYSPVLRKPNRFQTHVQFKESWVLSKVTRGNTYVLKERDARNVVVALYVLDPARVKPMVTDDGAVFYQLSTDNMAGLTEDVMVPASEIIHDRFNCLFHPLIGTSPLFAAGVAATQALNIQNNSATFFANRSMPGGVLTAPGAISEATADRLKTAWDSNFSGDKAGKVAVLGDGLKFEKMVMSAVESQLIEQLKWTDEAICRVYHMPLFMAGLGQLPGHENVEAMLNLYYSMCLQDYVQAIEACMTEGLSLATSMRVQLDEDTLLRMNKSMLYKTIGEGIRGGFIAPNEGRRQVNLKPIEGGDTVYLQEQDHSLAALAKRDARDDPFAKSSGGDQSPKLLPPSDDDDEDGEKAMDWDVLRADADNDLRSEPLMLPPPSAFQPSAGPQ